MSVLNLSTHRTLTHLHTLTTRNILRRHASSQPPKPPSKTSTYIPTAAWPWISPALAPFRAYGRMQKRSPLLTQLESTLTIYFLGDLSAQSVASSGFSDSTSYEPMRGLRALLIGGIVSIPNYKWFIFLGNHFNYSSHIFSLCVKIVVNQTVFTPLFNTYFFGMQSMLSGSTVGEAWKRVKDTVPVSWKNSWKVWPAVTAFSFTFIPPQYRSVFAGVIAIGWQTYLSWLNRSAEEKEVGTAIVGGTVPST